MLKPDYDVVVIGAGFAGLAATWQLRKAGKKVRLIEARDRVGGRVWTEHLSPQLYIDKGGQWMGANQDRLRAYAQNFGVETFKTHTTGANLLHIEGKRKPYKGLIPSLSWPALLNLDYAIKRLNRMARTVNLASPWLTPKAQEWDAVTLQHWLDKNLKFRAAHQLLTIGTEAIFAAHPSDISLLHALFYIKSGRDLQTLMNVENGAQEERFVGGAQSIAEKIAAECSTSLTLETAALAIKQHENVVVVSTPIEEISAQKAIIAIPPPLISKLFFEPTLPPHQHQLFQRMFMGAVVKSYVLYERPFWRNEGLSGQAVTNDGPLQIWFDNSPSEGTVGVMTGFALARQAQDFMQKDIEERQAIATQTLVNLLGEKARNIDRYLDKSWHSEWWSGGCYAAIMPPGAWTGVGQYLRKPFVHIHWAGTETSDVWNGYIDGAIRSGERAAAEVLALL